MIDVGRVAMINVEEIEIGERARQEMGDLEGLECSMKEVGLAQPLCVKEQSEGKPYYLLGGERRLGVLLKNGATLVPVRIYPSDISNIQTKSIELAENFFRKDFTWYEYDNLVREIHKLQQEIHGRKVSTAPDAGGWSMQDTATLMGITKAGVSTAVRRAEAREAFPELFDKCRTQKDASKVLDKMNEQVIKEALAQKIEAQKMSGTVTTLSNGYILKDFFEGVRSIGEHTVHLVEIDPPYGIALADQKKKDGVSMYNLDNYNEIGREYYLPFLRKVFDESYRVMTEHSWLICWFAPEPWFDAVYQLLNLSGFSTTRMCGIWTKGTSGQNMNPQTRLANSYEMFFYAWKGSPALAKPGRGNDFHYSPVPATQKTHPTERPVELMKDIYETFGFPGSRVMIPFLGSGSGLVAAHSLGMNAFGYELSKAYRDSFLVKIHRM